MGLRQVNQQAGRVYREVESTGVPVTVIRHDETWYGRMVREGKVRRAADDWALPARRWGTPEGFDLEQFLLGEREEDR